MKITRGSNSNVSVEQQLGGLTYCCEINLKSSVLLSSFSLFFHKSQSHTTISTFLAPLVFGLNPEMWSAVSQSTYSALFDFYSKMHFLPLFQILILQRSSVLRPDSRSPSLENSLRWWPGTSRLLQILPINHSSMSLLSLAPLSCSP